MSISKKIATDRENVDRNDEDDDDGDPDFQEKSGSKSGSGSSNSSSDSNSDSDSHSHREKSQKDDSEGSEPKAGGHSPIGFLSESDPFANNCQMAEIAGFVVFSATVASNPSNEDRILVDPSGLFCIFDGHGGSECSAFATEKFPAEFLKNYTKKESKPIDDLTSLFFSGTEQKSSRGDGSRREEARDALKQSFLAIDGEFLDTHGKKSPTTGSCGLACFVEGGVVWSAVVGDSRSILIVAQS